MTEKKRVIALGFFDGVHRAHRTVLSAACDYAAKDAEARSAQQEYETFRTVADRLAVRHERIKALQRLEKEGIPTHFVRELSERETLV